jgi:transposase
MYSKTKRDGRIKSDIVVVGIDVAKRSHVAAIRFPDGSIIKPFSFWNDRQGFEKLISRVEHACVESGVHGTLFALEATGHYGHALQHYLLREGRSVVGVNPAHTKRVKELLDGSPEKSDPKDSIIIADLAWQGRGRPVTQLYGVYAELRRLGKLREQLTKERTRYLNRYTGLVDLVFPELVGLVYDVTCPTIRSLLREFPTAPDIARRQYRLIRRLLWKWSIGHFDEERCRQIHEASKHSVGVREGLEAIRLQMRLTLSSLRSVESQLSAVEKTQTEALCQVAYAEQLLTIPEIGSVTVATILGETGDLRQYRSAEALIKLAGLNLYSLSSGTFHGRTRITKRGRPLLRRIIYLAALRMGKHGRPLAEFHDRLLERLAKPQIAVACSRKVLRMMFAIVRDGSVYQPDRLAAPAQAVA